MIKKSQRAQTGTNEHNRKITNNRGRNECEKERGRVAEEDAVEARKTGKYDEQERARATPEEETG